MYSAIASNKRTTWIITGLFTAFLALVIWVFSQIMGYGLETVGFALIFAGVGSFTSYWFSDKIILGMSGARPADRQRDFHFYTVTENLAMGARLPMPKLYVIEDTAMNAFATGRDPKHAVVCATTGLLAKLDRSELEGVVAHELAHIQNYDIRLLSVVSVMVGLLVLLSDWFLRLGGLGGKNSDDNKAGAFLFIAGVALALLSPIIAQLIKLAVSRNREYLADASAAKMTRYPQGLANALRKLTSDKEPLEAANKATAHMYIVNPLKNHHDAIGWFSGMFQTHPPIQERIARLEKM